MRSGVVKQKSKDKNIVIYRLKRRGERFEIQVLRDKLPAPDAIKAAKGNFIWEDILSQVAIFSNAAKSELAKPQDIATAFEDAPTERVLAMILEQGEQLQSQEDRAAATHSAHHEVESLADMVAARCVIRPAKAGGRAERMTAEIVERELKNARFKPPHTASREELLARAIRAVHDEGSVDVVRPSSIGYVVVENPEDFPSEIGKVIDPWSWRLLEQNGNRFKIVIDSEFAMAVKKHKGFAEVEAFAATVTPSPAENLVLMDFAAASSSAEAAAAKPKGKKGAAAEAEAAAAKSAPKGKKGGKAHHDDDDDDGGRVRTLEEELAALKADDSDDDRRRGGAKKGKATAPATAASGKQPAPKPAPKQAPAKAPASDDEDDVVSSRKAKKGAKGGKAQQRRDEDSNDES